jgi:hypothetical protein
MPDVKRLICLANSRKLSGRCVAGKEWIAKGGGSWVRPVSDRPSEEVSEHERQYKDGSDPQVLDIIDIPLKSPRPNSFQSENWLLDPETYWSLVKRAKWSDLASLTDDPALLWSNNSSSGNGLNDRVSEPESQKLKNSLYLLHLERLMIRVFVPFQKRKVRAEFVHHGVEYHLGVTDPIIEKKYLAVKDGDYKIAECFATVSLGEPFNGYCYKLVAALITPERCTE